MPTGQHSRLRCSDGCRCTRSDTRAGARDECTSPHLYFSCVTETYAHSLTRRTPRPHACAITVCAACPRGAKSSTLRASNLRERARQPQTQPVPRYQTGKHANTAREPTTTTHTDDESAAVPACTAGRQRPTHSTDTNTRTRGMPPHPRRRRGSSSSSSCSSATASSAVSSTRQRRRPACCCPPACLPAARCCCCCLLLARACPRPRDPHESAAMFFFIKLVLGTRPRRIEIDGSSTWSTRVDVGTGAAYCGCTPRTS